MASSHTDKPTRQRRPKGDGAIYPVGDGRYRGSLVIERLDGTRVRRYVRGASRADVSRKLKAIGTDASAGSRETLAAFLTRWLVANRPTVKASTWRQREQYIRSYIVPKLGQVPLARLTPAAVEGMTSALIAEGRSSRTAAHVRVILRRALADAMRDGLVVRNVAALARAPRVAPRDMEAGRDYFDAARLRALLGAVRDHDLGPLVTVAATTGLRQGELLGLAWADADLVGASLRVRRSLARAWDGGFELAEPKTGRSRRSINLPAAAVTALLAERERQDARRAAAGTAWQDRDGLVFTDALGRPLRNWAVSHGFTALLREVGLPHIPFHGLRHTAATAMLTAGVPLKVVSDVLGHANISITADVYAAVVPELRRDAADAMDRVLA